MLVESHAAFRSELRALVQAVEDLELVGEFDDGSGALRELANLRPAVVLVDLVLPDMSGLDVVRRIRAEAAGTRVLVVSMHVDDRIAEAVLDAGADGYVPKDVGGAGLLQTVRDVAGGSRPATRSEHSTQHDQPIPARESDFC